MLDPQHYSRAGVTTESNGRGSTADGVNLVGGSRDGDATSAGGSGGSAGLGVGAGSVAIELQQLSKRLGKKTVLSDVTLQISNRVTGLLGPNGAGKSTLIKVLLGLLRPTAGEGRLLGRDIRRDQLEIRQLVGYTPEDDCYIDGLTGVEMVQMSGQFYGIPGREALRRAHEVLDFCGIKQERYREIAGYSTGMRQQVKFASAIVHNPQFLILDEPTTGLDPEERERLLRRIKFLNRQFGIGVMLSTHILPDVQLVCDDVIVLAEGQVRTHQSLQSLQGVNRWRVQWLEPGEAVAGVWVPQVTRWGWRVEEAVDGSWELTVPEAERAEAAAVAERVWEASTAAGLTVLHLGPAQESLEAIFLKAIEGRAHAHS